MVSLGGKKIAEYLLPIYSVLNVANGDRVAAGDILARIPVQTKRTSDITGGLPRVEALLEVRRPTNPALLAEVDGTIELEDAKSKIIIRIEPDDGTAPVEYAVPKGTNLLVRSGDTVKKAEKLVDGDPVLQGVIINDKHIEILIREMTRRVEITNPGDTGFLMGQVVDRVDFEEENARVIRDGGKAFLGGNLGEFRIHVGVFFVFTICGRLQIFQGCADFARRECGGDFQIPPFQELEQAACVFFFLVRGFQKDFGNRLIAFFFRRRRKHRITVAGLGFTGKRHQQILFCLGTF